MMEHIKTYALLIEAGLPAVMTAHTLFPSLEPEDVPATLSKKILTDILKDELGFQGCVTTDCLGMGGIVSRFELSDAVIKAINAGADLMLIRDEGAIIEEIIPAVISAVEDGRIAEERIDDAIYRSFGVKYDYGYFSEEPLNGIKDPSKAGAGINSESVKLTASRAAKESFQILRDEPSILPLKPETKVLLVEQVHVLHMIANNKYCHPPVLWQKMLEHSNNVGCVEVSMEFEADDRKRAFNRIDECDVVVVTNYFGRREGKGKGDDFVGDIAKTGNPVIDVTNSPFPFTVKPEYKTVMVTYGVSPECLNEAA